MLSDPQLEVSVKLSAPIYVLKAQAKELKKTENISMTEALNQVAQREGFASWGLLAAKTRDFLPRSIAELVSFLNPGDLVLIASKPQGGKTSFALGLLVEAMRRHRPGYFFSLESDKKKTAAKLADIDETLGESQALLKFDFSEEISGDYICKTLDRGFIENGFVVVDYLQLLDQQRSKPPLQEQIEVLKSFANKAKCIFILISQMDRFVEASGNHRPVLSDIRLPNPLDLSLFNKVIFLENGKMVFVKPER